MLYVCQGCKGKSSWRIPHQGIISAHLLFSLRRWDWRERRGRGRGLFYCVERLEKALSSPPPFLSFPQARCGLNGFNDFLPQDIRRRRKEGEGTLSKLCLRVSPLLPPPPLLWAALKRGEEKREAASASITWNGFPLPYARHFMRKTLGKEGGDFLGENLFAQQHLSPLFFREAEYLYFELQAHPAPSPSFQRQKKNWHRSPSAPLS